MSLRYRVAALFAAYFFGLGLFLPYFPLVLAQAGLSPAEIGTVLALPLAVRLIANPLVGALADRYARPGPALAVLSALAALGFAGLSAASGFWSIALLLAVTSLAWGPIVPLSDALAARVAREGGGDYGRMRLWGSIAFIVANLGGGALVGAATDVVVVGGIVAGLAVSAFVAMSLPVASVRAAPEIALPADAPAPVAPPARTLWSPRFLLIIAAAGCVQASHAAYYAFSALHWSQAGLSGVWVGAFWGLGVVTEIVLFAMAGRIGARLGPGGLLALGAGAAILRWVLFPFAVDPVSIATLQVLHGLTFGATHLGGVAFVAASAPRHWAGAAQGVASTVVGGLTALASALAGVLYAIGPALAFDAMAGLAALGLVSLALARLAVRPASP